MVDLKYNAGGEESNSYVSRDEMFSYLDEQVPSLAKTAWLALSVDDQRRYLIMACRQVDRAHEYIGQRMSDLTGDARQNLKFPRGSFEIRSGKQNLEAYRDGGSYVIDPRVKRAQMIQALYLCKLQQVDGADDPLGGTTREKLQAEGVKSISIGNTSESYEPTGLSLCASAEDELRPLVRRSHRI